MALNELYELTVEADCLGQECNNIYFYRELSTFPAGLNSQRAQAIGSAFFQQHLPDISAISTPDMRYVKLTIRSLFDQVQKHEILLSGTGGANNEGGSSLPPFNAISFVLGGDNPAVKSGRKRFAGVGEAYQTDGLLNNEWGFFGVLNTVRNVLAANLLDTATQLIPWAAPVVVKRVRTGTPGNYQYRLPDALSEAIWSNVTSADYQLDITSQISRRRDKGK